MRGSPEAMNIEELKNVAIYEGFPKGGDDPTVQYDHLSSSLGSSSKTETNSNVIRIFWRIFNGLLPREQRSLLSFITGSSLIPCTGSSSLVLKLVNAGEGRGRFMTSRTCFNQLNLHNFDFEGGESGMEKLLRDAWEGSVGFDLK